MVSFVKSVAFDCSDPLALAAFWAAALGCIRPQGAREPGDDEAAVTRRGWPPPRVRVEVGKVRW